MAKDESLQAGGVVDVALGARTVKGAAWLIAWRMVSRVLGFASTLVLARVLVPADFGILAMATAFAASIEALSQLGLQDALVRRVDDSKDLYHTAFTLQLGRAVMTAVVIATCSPLVAWWFNEPRLTSILLVLSACTLVAGVENIGVAEFRRAMRFDMQFRLLLVPRVLQVLVGIPAALLLQSYWALLIGIAVSQVVRTAMSYAIHPFRPRLALNGWRELAGFSLWTWAACVVSLVWERGDPFILGPVIGPTQLGLYLISLELGILPVTEFIAPAADALFTAFAAAQQRGKSSVRHAPLVASALLICVLPITITISCGSGYLAAALLGLKWAAAAPLIATLSWLCLFSPLSFVCTVVLVANGHTRRNFLGKLAASAVKLATMLAVVTVTNRLDYIALAITACVAAESVAFFLLLKGVGPVRFRPIVGPLTRALLAGIATVAALYQAGLAWQSVTLPSFTALFACGIYGLTVLVLYSSLILLQWHIAGRPDGPETRIAQLMAGFALRLGQRVPRRQ